MILTRQDIENTIQAHNGTSASDYALRGLCKNFLETLDAITKANALVLAKKQLLVHL